VSLGQKPTLEADRDGMGPRLGVQLPKHVAHMALDRLLGEEEALPNLTVRQAGRDQLQDLDLTRCRFELSNEREGDDLRTPRPGARCCSLEPAQVVAVLAEDAFPLSGIHP
jgi:hypothetical protein